MKSTTYYCRLKVLSPVHIGCDEVYEPTGFAIDEEQKELIAFEAASFLGLLEQEHLDRFSVICRKGTVQSMLEIYKFIRRHKEHAHGRRVYVPEAFIAHYNKTLKLAPGAVGQQLNKFQLARTAFQPVNGKPYIPGSAVKGALRTAVLNLRNNGKSHPRYRNGKQLNDELSGGTFATDPFRLVKVGDFQASGAVRQKIVYAVNRKKKPSEKEARGPYQILEVIDAGTEFVGTITMQAPSAGAGIRRPVDMDELISALGFYGSELQREKISLKAIGCSRAIQDLEPNGKKLIRVGRHSGAECVTVAGHRDIKIMQGPGTQPKYKNHATTLWLAAESDKPSTNRFLQPFGWMEFSLLTTKESGHYRQQQTASFNTWEQDQQKTIAAFTVRAEKLARQQEEERRQQELEAAEQRRREEEQQKYPWRAFLPRLESITNWGELRTQALDHTDFLQYQSEAEVGKAVATAAKTVCQQKPEKWTTDRDAVVGQWLSVSGTSWTPLAEKAPATVKKISQVDKKLLERIMGLTSWSEYTQSKIKIGKLDKECAQALKAKFSTWKLKKSKDKQQKIAFNALVKRLKKLS